MTVDGERLDSIEQQMARSSQATTDLRLSVEALREPIRVIAEIKAENQETRRRVESAQKAAEAARVAGVEREAALRKASAERDRRVRRSTLLALTLGAGLLLLVTTMTFVALIGYVHTLLDEQREATVKAEVDRRQASYRSCLTRNEAVSVQSKREHILADLNEGSPAGRKAHADSARELDRLLIDCDQYKRRP